MRTCFYGMDPDTMLLSGYVCDFIMYITSTEKQVRVSVVCEIVFIKAGMYITFVYFMILPGLGMSMALLCIQLVQTVCQIKTSG
jgi:hypothetical protein